MHNHIHLNLKFSFFFVLLYSREKFGEMHARLWWEENRARIQEQYLWDCDYRRAFFKDNCFSRLTELVQLKSFTTLWILDSVSFFPVDNLASNCNFQLWSFTVTLEKCRWWEMLKKWNFSLQLSLLMPMSCSGVVNNVFHLVWNLNYSKWCY